MQSGDFQGILTVGHAPETPLAYLSIYLSIYLFTDKYGIPGV